jgi:hypothetical protein
MTAAPGWHAFHIHSGSCAAPGPIETIIPGLGFIPDISPPGGHIIESLVERTELGAFQDGNHYLDIHAEATGGAIVSCAEMPRGTPADGTTPPRPPSVVRLRLDEQRDSGVTGDLLLWESRRCCPIDTKAVAVAADIAAGLDAGQLAIDIRTGSCSFPSPFETGIWGYWEPPDWFDRDGGTSVSAGNPSYQGFVPIELAALQDGNHYVQIRTGVTDIPDEGGNPVGSAGGVVVACADIPEA